MSVKDNKTSEKKILDGVRFNDGVTSKAKLIGIEDVKVETGDDVCNTSMVKLKAVVSAKKEHKLQIILKISLEGVSILDAKTSEVLHKHAVNRISYISRDPTDSRAFGYIFKNTKDELQYVAIKTERQSSDVVLTLKDLFEVVYEKNEADKVAAAAATSEPSIVQENQQQQQQEDEDTCCKDKLNTSWKFSTINDDEGINEKINLLDDDTTCEDQKDDKNLNFNSILHIDDGDDLSSSSVSTSTPPSSAASSPVEQNVNLNDTIENLAFSLLNKLTLQPVCETVVVESCGSKPQLIIDDVLLMSRKDGRPVVPLAEQEQSFNSIEQVKIEDDDDEVVEPVVVVVETTAFMMLINKIVPNSHMIEHRFEYDVCKVDDDDDDDEHWPQQQRSQQQPIMTDD